MTDWHYNKCPICGSTKIGLRVKLNQFKCTAEGCGHEWLNVPQPEPPMGEPIQQINDPNTGVKFDDNKPRFDLIPPEAMEELAKLYGFGAKKYADRNWEKGIKTTRLFAAIMRHAWAWMRGETIDAETGLHHMASVAWGAFAIVTFAKREYIQGQDDRPKVNL